MCHKAYSLCHCVSTTDWFMPVSTIRLWHFSLQLCCVAACCRPSFDVELTTVVLVIHVTTNVNSYFMKTIIWLYTAAAQTVVVYLYFHAVKRQFGYHVYGHRHILGMGECPLPPFLYLRIVFFKQLSWRGANKQNWGKSGGRGVCTLRTGSNH